METPTENIKTPADDRRAVAAARHYGADNFTFQEIAEALDVSRSHAQALVRRGIAILETEKVVNTVPDNPGTHHELPRNNPGTQHGVPNPATGMPSLSFPQDPRSGSYMLETTGIGRRVLLTPKALMVFDLWKGAGFPGDLSDFLEDSVMYLYETKRPAERN